MAPTTFLSTSESTGGARVNSSSKLEANLSPFCSGQTNQTVMQEIQCSPHTQIHCPHTCRCPPHTHTNTCRPTDLGLKGGLISLLASFSQSIGLKKAWFLISALPFWGWQPRR